MCPKLLFILWQLGVCTSSLVPSLTHIYEIFIAHTETVKQPTIINCHDFYKNNTFTFLALPLWPGYTATGNIIFQACGSLVWDCGVGDTLSLHTPFSQAHRIPVESYFIL